MKTDFTRQLAEPLHVGPDELTVLRWIAETVRPINTAPAGMSFALACISRRRLRTLGLIACDVSDQRGPGVYRLTEAGDEYLTGKGGQS